MTTDTQLQGETLERETVCANCEGKLYQTADPNNIHWYHEGTGDVPCPTRFAALRAAVAGPRGDAAMTAQNRETAQKVVMSTESVLGERFNIATRHELADRITAALDATTRSSTDVADVLRKLSDQFNRADNGHCTICHQHRLYDTRGKVQPCENVDCLSHRIGSIL